MSTSPPYPGSGEPPRPDAGPPYGGPTSRAGPVPRRPYPGSQYPGSQYPGAVPRTYPAGQYPGRPVPRQASTRAASTRGAASTRPGLRRRPAAVPRRPYAAADPLVATSFSDWWAKVIGVLSRSWQPLLIIQLATVVPGMLIAAVRHRGRRNRLDRRVGRARLIVGVHRRAHPVRGRAARPGRVGVRRRQAGVGAGGRCRTGAHASPRAGRCRCWAGACSPGSSSCSGSSCWSCRASTCSSSSAPR